MERWGSRQCCTLATRSWSGVLIHGSLYWFPISAPMSALLVDWDCYRATLQESGASREGKALCSHCFTIVHIRQRTAEEKRLLVRMKWILSALWVLLEKEEKERERVCVSLVRKHICILCSSSGISQGHARKVCQRERRGRVEISREYLGALLHLCL